MCPGSWVYHYISLSEAASDDHRRRALLVEEGDNDDHDDDDDDDGEPHMKFTVRLQKNALFMLALRYDFPPAFNSQNVYNLLVDAKNDPSQIAVNRIVTYTMDVCDVAREAHEALYVGLFADDLGCCLYDVVATRFSGDCSSSVGNV